MMNGSYMNGWDWIGMAMCVVVIAGLAGLCLWALARVPEGPHDSEPRP